MSHGPNGIIKLAGIEPVAEGFQRLVYAYPGNPGLLIKILRDRSSQEDAPPRERGTGRYGVFRSALAEIEEYIALRTRAPDEAALVERVVGLAATDLGTGLVVEALKDRDGRLAPTFLKLTHSGRLDRELLDRFEAFIDRVLASQMVAYDIRAHNIVYAYCPETDEDRFVLVDGLGERLPLPLNRWSRRLNAYNKARRIRRMRAEICAFAGRQIFALS